MRRQPGPKARAALAELALGARLAATGGRDCLLRTVLTAVGVAVGVAVLLLAASVPTMQERRTDRIHAITDALFAEPAARPTERTVLALSVETSFRGADIRGAVVRPEGAHPVAYPGVVRYPASGRMLVSPALERLLRQPGSALLRGRLGLSGGRADRVIAGTLTEAGLTGPQDYAYVLTSTTLQATTDGAGRYDHFGSSPSRRPLSAPLLLLLLVGMVVLFAPVLVFIAVSARFGGERRDRRLAALRLAGADRAGVQRIAAGESLVGSTLGLLLGAAVFLVGRRFAGLVVVQGLSVYPSDLVPRPGLAALVAVGVPGLALAVTRFSLRRVTADPLAEVRRGGRPHGAAGERPRGLRAWAVVWRLALPVLGLALLAVAVPQADALYASRARLVLAVAAILLVVLGVAALLPWVLAAVLRVLPRGTVSWQLAVRRLQFGGGAGHRSVVGVVVLVTGALAASMLFSGISQGLVVPAGALAGVGPESVPLSRMAGADAVAQLHVPAIAAAREVRDLAARPGVSWAEAYGELDLRGPGDWYGTLVVADCPMLRGLLEIARCADGDAFVTEDPAAAPPSGSRVVVAAPEGSAVQARWTLPAAGDRVPGGTARYTAAPAAPGAGRFLIGGTRLLTPRAAAAYPALARSVGVRLFLGVDRRRADADDLVRNAVAAQDPLAETRFAGDLGTDKQFAAVTRDLLAAADTTMLLVALSMLVGLLEQLRERRRPLAVLDAFGTRRGTLALSLLWQSALPVAVGLALAAVFGLACGALLQHSAGLSSSLPWARLAVLLGSGGGVVLLVTVLTLPALGRLTRPEGLRYE